MAIYSDVNLSSGVDTALISIATQIPALPIAVLIFTFIIVLVGGTSAQSRRFGYSDWAMWSLLASLSCLLLSLIMTINLGLIDLGTLGIVIALNILTAFWFFTSRGRFETA
jgi:hypothetical protein